MSRSALPPPPPIAAEGMLEREDGHRIFWDEAGTPDGVPTLYLHGGPGGRLTPGHRRNVPADRVRIIALSQRGAGRSTPSAGAPGPVDLSVLTTAHLVADLEALREHLGVNAWLVQGVSWGSTLAQSSTAVWRTYDSLHIVHLVMVAQSEESARSGL